MNRSLLFFTIIVISFAANAWAGWVVEYASGDVTYLSSGKMKEISKEDGISSFYDGKSDKLGMFQQGKRVYWRGTAKEFCTVWKQLIPQLEQKPAKPSISIKQAGNEAIAGISTKKYQVMVDGQLHKEIWIAENQELVNEIKVVNKFMEDFSRCYPAQTTEEMVDRDPAYLKLESRGYLMKEVTYLYGNMPVNSKEVVSLRKKDIPDSEFEVPAGFRSVESFMEIYQ